MKKYGKIIIIVVGILAIIALLILVYFKITFISKNEVKDIVSDNMNVSSSDLYFENIDLELDKSVYEVEVYYQNRDYEYKIDAKEGKVILDRSKAGIQYAIDFGMTRECLIDTEETIANIFVDNSIIEIFINKGEKVFTSRVFPEKDQNGIQIKSGKPIGKYFELEYSQK